MDSYAASAVEWCQADLPKAASPWLSEEEWSAVDETPGALAHVCASHVATLLFLARMSRPDITTPVARLCSVVSRWTVVCDRALARLMGYLARHPHVSLVGQLSSADRDKVQLALWTDDDWKATRPPRRARPVSGLSSMCQGRTAHGF